MPAARVLIDGPNELVFDYAIPEGMEVQAGCRVKIPLRNRSSTGTILEMSDESNMNFALREISKLIDPEPLITPKLMKMGRWMADYYGSPMELVMRALLPEAVRQETHSEKTRKIVNLLSMPDDEVFEKLATRAPRQHLMLTLIHAAGGQLPLTDLGTGASASVKAMMKHNWVNIIEEAIRRDPDEGESFVKDSPLELNKEQGMVMERVITEIEKPKSPILLHGVTGSGKTEIYLQAAQKCINLGKSVLVLLPEIALAPQTVQRFKSRFAANQNQVAVLHSNLSQGERFDEWHRIRSGEAKIVIGARSAVFAPLRNLGIIIVDEEHENSYKQDTAPRYHGRDIAVLRAHMEKCAILLGSATPSLESYQNTETKKYQLLKLNERADGQSMPIIRVVDMKIEGRKHKGAGPAILSDPLRANMEKKLAEGEQVILFLNRRGFARSLQCPSCGLVCECRHCSIPLTYHRAEERLICHICGHQAITPKKCPDCQDPGIRFQGYGTEQVEGVLKKVFPLAKLARIDTDTMRRKNALRDTLKAFRQRKIDIIIGTQMIAKGLHFPNVTLVGVLNADLGLHVPDFRAGERTFQLLTQVAGRAGRGELKGEVIIQTYTPHSPSIQFARHHDFNGYADQELEFRQRFGYPPYTHCALIGTRSTHERRAEFTLQNLHQRLKKNLPPHFVLGEPLPSPVVRTHGKFRFQLMLLAPSARQLSQHINQILNQTPPPDDVTIVFDMDAMGF